MKLIFVYNANSGPVNALLDSVHKIVSPSTYDCNLCDITFGAFSENDDWKAFREALEMELLFLHKDQFQKMYKSKWLPKYDFPVILSEENNELQLFIPSETLNSLENSQALIQLISDRI